MSVVVCTFELAPQAAEDLDEQLALLADARWTVWEDRIAGRLWMTGYFDSHREAKKASRRLAQLVGSVRAAGEGECRELADADWADSYKAHFKAWRIGRRHWVPEWERRTFRVKPGEAVVWLDPGMAFGTGNHESTRLCCERLVEYAEVCERRSPGRQCRPGRVATGLDARGPGVIDAGCGSGILAISAARFGLGPVVGFDNDSIAVRVSRENAVLNEVDGSVQFFEGDLSTGLAGRQAGIVLANIHTDVLRAGARELVASVAPGGWLALSGILAGDLNDLRADFLAEAARGVPGEPDQAGITRKANGWPTGFGRRGRTRMTAGWRTASRRLGEWADLLLIRER